MDGKGTEWVPSWIQHTEYTIQSKETQGDGIASAPAPRRWEPHGSTAFVTLVKQRYCRLDRVQTQLAECAEPDT